MVRLSWGHETDEQRRARRQYEETLGLYEQAIRQSRMTRVLSELNVGAVAPSTPKYPTGLEFINKETPAGLVDGLNRTFRLAKKPVNGSDHIYMNGLLQDSDPECDYTITGQLIIFNEAPPVGSKLKCSYIVFA
jgi:hypothetical protein